METISKRRDFEELYRSGTRKTYSTLMIFAKDHPEGRRFGLSVSRRVGKAVLRNRVKRRLRELIRKSESRFPPQKSYLLVARPGQGAATFQQLETDLERYLEDASRERA